MSQPTATPPPMVVLNRASQPRVVKATKAAETGRRRNPFDTGLPARCFHGRRIESICRTCEFEAPKLAAAKP